MAITALFEVPGMTAEQFDKAWDELRARGLEAPDGRLLHVAAPIEGGWQVFDVWENEEKLGAFAEQLMPILAGLGVTPPQPRVAQVYFRYPA
jgi:hypothetical protein